VPMGDVQAMAAGISRLLAEPALAAEWELAAVKEHETTSPSS
jgi:hypothetical protein